MQSQKNICIKILCCNTSGKCITCFPPNSQPILQAVICNAAALSYDKQEESNMISLKISEWDRLGPYK